MAPLYFFKFDLNIIKSQYSEWSDYDFCQIWYRCDQYF